MEKKMDFLLLVLESSMLPLIRLEELRIISSLTTAIYLT